MSLKMTKESNNKLLDIIDSLLLANLFAVVFLSLFFIFAVVMNLNGVSIFLDFVQKIWNPLIVPLITVLIISSIINGINSWWRRKLLPQEEDI